MRIGFRIPEVVIDAVCDSHQTIATRAQQPVESVTLFGRLNLARITRADSRERVGGDDAGFQRGCVTVQSEVVTVRRITKAKPPEITGVKQALITDIVQRQQRFRVLKKFVVTTTRAQLRNRKATGPIVSVDYVRREAQVFEQRERRAREERVTNVVVVVTVDVGTREKLGSFEQVSWRPGSVAIPETHEMNLAAPFNANVLDRTAVQECAIDLVVERKDELRFDVLLDECFGECARDIRQPTGFGKRHSFRCQDSDAHTERES